MPPSVQDGDIVLFASAKEGNHKPQKFKLRPGQKLNCLAKSYCKFRQLRADAGLRVTMSTKKFWVLDERAEPIKYGLRDGDTVFFEVHGPSTASASSDAMSAMSGNSHGQPRKRSPQSIALANDSKDDGIFQPTDIDAKKTVPRRVHVPSNPKSASSSGQPSSASVATLSRRVHVPSHPEAASSSGQRSSGSIAGKEPVRVTIWWRCPSCDFTVSMSKKPYLRTMLKYNHIRNRHSKAKIAKTKNFKARASMYRAIWNGKLKKSPGGLMKEDLCISHKGKIVPKRRSEHSKKNAAKSGWAENWRTWCKSHAQVRTELGIEGSLLPKRHGTPAQKNLHTKVSECWAEKKIAAVNSALSKAGSSKVMGWIHKSADSNNSP